MKSGQKRPADDKADTPLPSASDQSKAADTADAARASTKHLIVGLGASAGGLRSLELFFTHLPAQTGMAFVVVQHLDPTHKSMMAEILGRYTRFPVVQATHNLHIESDHIYVIPPNFDLLVSHGALQLRAPSAPRGLRTPIDTFFRSLADDQGDSAVGIVLSGSGSDGTLGLQAIKEQGGLVIAQSPENAEYDNMPASAIGTGIMDFVANAEDIPAILMRYAKHYFSADDAETGTPSDETDNRIAAILKLIDARTDRDFTVYKPGTVVRRLTRRMRLNQCRNLREYQALVKKSPPELQAASDDLLIGVTRFFRDPEAWEVLKEEVLPKCFASKEQNATIRVWVPACSTGEEAYTVGILMREYMEDQEDQRDVQIFATDIDERAITKARLGQYPTSIATDVSASRLRRNFRQSGGHFEVSKPLRSMVVFSLQNLITSPPFTNVDLVCCRNVLIYLKPDVQQRVLHLLHYALNLPGFLMLGAAENVGDGEDCFATLSSKWRIYSKLPATPRYSRKVLPTDYPGKLPRESEMPPKKPSNQIVAQHALLDALVPPTAVINRNAELLYLHGKVSEFLEHPPGEPSIDLMRLLRDGMAGVVRAGMTKAAQTGSPATVRFGTLARGRSREIVEVTVTPADSGGDNASDLMLVSFRRQTRSRRKKHDSNELTAEGHELIHRLEDELQSTRDALQRTISELQYANQELNSRNQESQSVNEELQSTNEELETSKEELQSLNEELYTVNNELEKRIEEQAEVNDTLNNLINSMNIATLFLDRQLCIRRFTAPVQRLFRLIPNDIGRALIDITRRFDDPDMMADAEHVLDTLEFREREVRSDEGRWYRRRILPYRTENNRVDGLLILMDDITERIARETALRTSEQRLALALKVSGAGVYDHFVPLERGPMWHSDTWAAILGYSRNELPQQQEFLEWLQAQAHPDDVGQMLDAYHQFVSGSTNEYRTELRLRHKDGSWVWVRGVSTAVERDSDGKVTHIIGVMNDISSEKRLEGVLRARGERLQKVASVRGEELAQAMEKLSVSEQRLQTALDAAGLGIWDWDLRTGSIEWAGHHEQIYGFRKDEFDGTFASFEKNIFPEDKEGIRQEIERARRDHDDYYREYRVVAPGTGKIRWVAARGRFNYDENGQPVRMCGVVREFAPDDKETGRERLLARPPDMAAAKNSRGKSGTAGRN